MEGIIVPIAKKRGAERVEEHRGGDVDADSVQNICNGISGKVEKGDGKEGNVTKGAGGVQEGKGGD